MFPMTPLSLSTTTTTLLPEDLAGRIKMKRSRPLTERSDKENERQNLCVCVCVYTYLPTNIYDEILLSGRIKRERERRENGKETNKWTKRKREKESYITSTAGKNQEAYFTENPRILHIIILSSEATPTVEGKVKRKENFILHISYINKSTSFSWSGNECKR